MATESEMLEMAQAQGYTTEGMDKITRALEHGMMSDERNELEMALRHLGKAWRSLGMRREAASKAGGQ